jgi:hypothetical protein
MHTCCFMCCLPSFFHDSNYLLYSDRNNSSYSTFQDTGKNDSYCWVCHEGGEVLCCDKCPRVFHFKCTKLDQEPEGEEWFCPVCFVSCTPAEIIFVVYCDLVLCMHCRTCSVSTPG